MADTRLDVYLFFDGNCKEAMEFYKSIFGGELNLQSYDEVPDQGDESMKGKTIHAMLDGGEIRLMGSDPDTKKKQLGSGKIELSLSGTDEARLREVFGSLSAGGNIKFPLEKQFWGDTFGTLTDKFGVDWMVNISGGQAPASGGA
jgi:PhnB protein